MRGPTILDFRMEPWESGLLNEVLNHARHGGLLAMPTETVYGFGCIVKEEAVRALSALKGRSEDRPFLVLIPAMAQAESLRWPPYARELAKVFWPGALTLILSDPARAFPPGVRSLEGGVAVRVTPNPLAGRLVEELGVPVVSTSANQAGEAPALTALEAASAGERLGAGPDLWVLDGGTLDPSEPSTIVDCTGSSPRVVRSGAIPIHRLRCVFPSIDETD